MADQFQIPQRTPPQAAPVAPPYELIQNYINRPFQYAGMVGDAANKLYEGYLNQQKLKAGAFEAGGPALMQALYGGGTPPQPQGQSPAPQPQGIAPSPQPQGVTPSYQPQGGMSQPAQAQGGQSGIPETIQATLDHPQLGVHAQKILELQKQMGQNAQMGKYGQTLNTGLKDQLSAEQALMGQEQFQQGQNKQQNQFNTEMDMKNRQYDESKDLERKSKSSELQIKYGGENDKYIRAANALKELSSAWDRVPNTYKGAVVGGATAGVGKLAGKVNQNIVDFNDARKLALNELSSAFLPESQRANPLEAKKIDDALFSLQSTPQGKSNSLKSTLDRLRNMAKQNETTYQTAASTFGGSIKPSVLPFMQTATGPGGHKIGSNDGRTWFDAQTGQPIP